MIYYIPELNQYKFDETGLPESAIEVSEQLYSSLLGKEIEAGPDGIPRLTIAEFRKELKKQVTAKRWEIETGGINLPNGVSIDTSTNSQDRITSVIVNAEIAGIDIVDFKADNGWVTMNLSDVKSIATVIAYHVQACFSSERIHHEAIDTLPDSEVRKYNINIGWPE